MTSLFPGQSNQSAIMSSATPTHDQQCSIRIIRKCVVTKLSPYWAGVCEHLGYPPGNFKCATDKKSVIAVLEYWINVGEREGRPKTWSMFAAEVLSNNQHPTVSTEICESLRREGIHIVPPSSRSHGPPSKRHYHQPQLVQDNLSSFSCITDVPDDGMTKTDNSTNQSATNKTARPTEVKCDMKTMYKCVVSKLAPYWTTVGDYLEYSVRERNAFKGADNKKSLIAVLENWICTDNGRQPKTWSTFTRVLMELDQDLSISVGSEICASLERELSSGAAGSTIPGSQQPPTRSVSYSTSPAQPHAHHYFKQSSSFPTAGQPMSIPTRRQQSGDNNVRKRLGYEMSQLSIAEETHKQPSQRPQYGQSYAPPHQPPYDTRISDRLPPSATYTGYPAVTGYGPPSSMMTGPSQSSPIQQPWYQPSSIGPMGHPQSHQSVGVAQGPLYSLQPAGFQPRPFHPRSRQHPAVQRKPEQFEQGKVQQTQPGSVQFLIRPPPRDQPHSMYTQQQLFQQQKQSLQPSPKERVEQPQQKQDRRLLAHQMPQYQQNFHEQTIEQQVNQHAVQHESPQHQLQQQPQMHSMFTWGQYEQHRRNVQQQQAQTPKRKSRQFPQQLPSQQMEQPQSFQPSQQGRYVHPAAQLQSLQQTQHGRPPVMQDQQYYQQNLGQPMDQQVNKQPMRQKSAQTQSQQQQAWEQLQAWQDQQTQQQQQQKLPMQIALYDMAGPSDKPQAEQHQVSSRQEEGLFTEGNTVMVSPEACADDIQEQYNLQPSNQDQPAFNSQDIIDYNGVAKVTDQGVNGHHSNKGEERRASSDQKWTTKTPSCADSSTTATTTKSICNVSTTSSPPHTAAQSGIQFPTESTTPQVNVQTPTDSNVEDQHQSTPHAAKSSTTTDYCNGGPVCAPFKWKKGKILGSGAFGRVFLCMDEDNKRTLAVKEVEVDPNWSNATKKVVESLEKEITILRKLKHDRIVQYYGTERSESCVRIFMEYMEGGSLYHYIDNKGSLKEHVTSEYTRQLLEGVDYLHISKIIHRDIKGANILMDHRGLNIKIADFGASKLLRSIYLSVRTQDRKNTSNRSVTGTAYWMAPEVIRGENIDRKADIWSVGCTVVEMLTCRPPYGHLESFAAMFKIATEPMCCNLPAKCSSHTRDFLSQCFISTASERPTASMLLKHQFIQQIGISNDEDTTDGGNVNANTMTSTEQQPQQATDSRGVDTVTIVEPQSETGLDTLTPAVTATNTVAVAIVGTVSSDQSDDTLDDDADDDDDTITPLKEAAKQPASTKQMPSSMQTATTVDSAGRVAPTNPQLMQAPTESSSTNVSSDYASSATGYTSNIDDNTAGLKSLPVKNMNHEISNTSNTSSNTCAKGSVILCPSDSALWKNKKEELQNASNAFVSNLFGNFPSSEEGTAAGGNPVQVVQIFMQSSNLNLSQVGPSSLPDIDHSKITHNSLEPFAQDICSSVDVQTILPWLIQFDLVTRFDQEYFTSHYCTSVQKQQKLMCLAISLHEKYVEKFLECLSKTVGEHPLHGELLKKIYNMREKTSESDQYLDNQ